MRNVHSVVAVVVAFSGIAIACAAAPAPTQSDLAATDPAPTGSSGGGVKSQACSTDADCSGTPATPSCVNYVCAAKPSTEGGGTVGTSCKADTDCQKGLVCDKGKCDISAAPVGAKCKEDDDCGPGEYCKGAPNGNCTAGSGSSSSSSSTSSGGSSSSSTGGVCDPADPKDCPSGYSCVSGHCKASSSSSSSSSSSGASTSSSSSSGGGACSDYAAPSTPAGCHASATKPLDPNGCYGGYYCTLATLKCGPKPAVCP
jgi:cellulose 1,4-beta-cellobiosidase